MINAEQLQPGWYAFELESSEDEAMLEEHRVQLHDLLDRNFGGATAVEAREREGHEGLWLHGNGRPSFVDHLQGWGLILNGEGVEELPDHDLVSATDKRRFDFIRAMREGGLKVVLKRCEGEAPAAREAIYDIDPELEFDSKLAFELLMDEEQAPEVVPYSAVDDRTLLVI